MWGTFGSGDGQFALPTEVKVGGSGNVFVVDNGARVKVFSSAGAFLRQWTPFDEFRIGGIAVDAYDNVYLSGSALPDGPGGIYKFTSTGTLLTHWGSHDFDYPPGLAVDGLGNVYATDDHYDVQIFTSAGVYLREWSPSSALNDLAVDSAGNVYLACSGHIKKYANDGTYLTQWAGGAGDGQFNAIRVAVGPDGHVYAADHNNCRVQAFTSDGSFLAMWGSVGSSPGQFSLPIGIAVDAHGDIYVADTNNGRIQKFGFAPTPVQSVTWGSMKARYRGAPGAAQPTTQGK